MSELFLYKGIGFLYNTNGMVMDRSSKIMPGWLGLLALVVIIGLPVSASAAIIRDTEIEQTLLKMARPMAQQAGLNPDRIGVRIVNNSQYNAFVMADSIIFIHSGLLMQAENMIEVAGVMAHEIGHIASGHVQRRGEVIEDAGITSLLGVVAAVALSAAGSGDAAFGVLAGGFDRSTRIVMARSRQDEGVADEWAIRLMKSQNYSLHPMTETMRKLAAQRMLPQSRQTDYYLSHPGALERSAVFQDYINNHEKDPLPEPAWMEASFQRIKEKLEAWTFPPKTTIANTIGDESPEARFKRAVAFLRLSDVVAARDEMAELVTAFPDDPYYREFYGDTLRSSGEGLAAARQYEKTLMIFEGEAFADQPVNTGQILLSMGRAYLATGDPEHLPLAIEALEMATIEEPEWAFVKHQLGIGYGKAGRFAEADLTLAEEALLKRNTELATQLAKRVSANPDATPVQKQLAADIIAQAGS